MCRQSPKHGYKDTLRLLQIELVKLQNHIIKHNDKDLKYSKDGMPAARMATSNASSSI